MADIEKSREYTKRYKDKLANNKKKVKFPKPGELVKTSVALCSCCIYHATCGGYAYHTCDYVLITHKNRGCKVGECDKFEEKTKNREPKLPRKLTVFMEKS